MSGTLTRQVAQGTPAPYDVNGLFDHLDPWDVDGTPVTFPLGPTPATEVYHVLVEYTSRAIRAQPVSLVRPTTAAPNVHPGTAALAELQEWLQMPLDEIVAIVGLQASTRQYWRLKPAAAVRPSKAGRLLRFRTTVGLLVGAVGLDRARHLLHDEGWLGRTLSEADLAALEARTRQVIQPVGPIAPSRLGHLSTEELRNLAMSNDGEDEQRRAEARRTDRPRGGLRPR